MEGAADVIIPVALLALVGLAAGSFANYLIYSWAYFPRHISPWAPPHPEAPPRRGADRLPLLGWFGLRRETPLHGGGFWVRPLLVELGCGAALPALYWYYTATGGILPPDFRTAANMAAFSPWAHQLLLSHGLLMVLLVAASFIDFDERTIPDIITLPGTLLGLVLAVALSLPLLPCLVPWSPTRPIQPATFNIPWPYDTRWNGMRGLALGWFLWTGWIFALLDRHLVLRHGWRRAVGYLLHGIRRHGATKWLLLLWLVGAVLQLAVWAAGQQSWRHLLSALIGLAVGGGVVWAVRIVAGWAMGQEAMGFGDVTLMAMIGAFVGWQVAIAGFFLAPVAAIAIVLIQFAVTRQPAVPFGPYLCAGTVIAVLGWHTVWNETLVLYAELGKVAVAILIGALLLMGLLLRLWRLIKSRLFLSLR